MLKGVDIFPQLQNYSQTVHAIFSEAKQRPYLVNENFLTLS